MSGLAVFPPVEERSPFAFLDHGLTACSMNDPAMATTVVQPESGKPIYTKVKVPRTTDFSTLRTLTAQLPTEQLVNAFFGVFNIAGERLGVSANQDAALKASAGEKGIAIVADGGKSLIVEGGPGVTAYVGLLIGTQGTTALTLRAAAASATSPNFALAAKGISLRCGTKGTGLSALPTSFVPSELGVIGGPILLGA